MANTGAFHRSLTLQAFTVLSVLSIFAADVEGGDACPRFSCGHLRDVRSPFRRRDDPPECGSQSHELICSDSKAKILISNTEYYVATINYTISSFWVVNANLDTNSSCPLPYPSFPSSGIIDSDGFVNFKATAPWACFVNCSRVIANNSWYKPVACLSAKNSHVYVRAAYYGCEIGYLQPSCRSLNMIPFGVEWASSNQELHIESYDDIMEFIRMGFPVHFPFHGALVSIHAFSFNECVKNSTRFVLAPMAVLIFLAHKYWKTRITIDAVEKFLRMQQMIGPVRYVYTDIIAITEHFRDKLGQGGYGSVYKGVLLPGNVHVAVKTQDVRGQR